MALDLSTLSPAQQIAAIYVGYYDRAADPFGNDFWEAALANPNLDLEDIATDFSTQAETLNVHPFFSNPTADAAEDFITDVFQNLFNRDPDAAGLTFWSDALVAAINDEDGAISVGEIILAIIEGAQNSPAGNDLTTILNKLEVAVAWTDAADAAGFNTEDAYGDNSALQASAKSIIEGVTDAQSTVVAAKVAIDGFFGDNSGTPGDTYLLTSGTDVINGTSDDDAFDAYIQQNPFAGGISNSLSSADRLDGGGGNDRLYAELTKEFAGVTSDNGSSSRTDIQPRLKNIEEIDLEARDDTEDGENPLDTIIVDAKNITDHVEIGSYYSDGDLKIENLTTLTAGGSARNTSEITVTMDHTDNFNTDDDASDLEVLFDNDYLLSGQEAEGKIFYFLLDEDAELAGNPNRLNNIDVDGIRFTITNPDGSTTDVTLDSDQANVAGTHQGFVNALQAPLQALIADGTLPAGTTLTLDPTVTDFTFLDDGSRSDDIPAIVLTSGDGSRIEATGFSRVEEPIGEYDVYGRFNSVNEVEDQPITVDIDLHKAGRGGEGGDLVVGGKSEATPSGIADGIEVFNINVLGAGNDDPNGGMTKPSNVGTITSTGNELREVYITTDAAFASGDTFASLTVRNGFDQDTSANIESGDLQLINADGFLGDLTLGDLGAANNAGRITNADTITAQGGGNVTLGLLLDGNETDQAYSVTTGSGNDSINMIIDGDAVDYANSSVNISTGDGDDTVLVDFDLEDIGGQNEQLNQAILDNVLIETGAGNDTITIDDNAFGSDIGNANIRAGSGNDTVYTDGAANPSGQNAVWAFNFDNIRADAQGGIGLSGADDLPGVQTSLAYVGNATVTVTLSGAGLANLAAGGGVMAVAAAGAIAGDDGYEASSTIESLINGNEYYGDQRDVNAAVIDAINNDDVLGKLLVASMGANNTVVVRSLTSGDFAAIDLRVDISQRDADTENYANAVLSEAEQVFRNSDLTLTDLWGTTSFVTPADYQAGAPAGESGDLTSSGTANAWYDGLSVAGGTNSADDNLHTAGTASIYEQDNTIDGGSGDDVIVLSTDAVANAVTPFTVSSNNALINGASNQTVILTGSNIGDDTVMNFTTAGAASTVNAGIDFLDFTAYLTSLENQSAAPGTDSDTLIPVTLDTNLSDVQANEVSVVTFDNTDDAGETFAALSASVIEQLFNNGGGFTGFNGDSTFGNLSAASANADDEYAQTANTDDLINGAAKSILMVENADNDGEYKVFELSWNGDASADADSTNDGQVSATLLGSMDFGDSLTGLAEANLVGSLDYAAILANGLGGAVTPPPPPGGATVVDLSGQTAVTAVDGTAEVFVLDFDSTSGVALSSDAVVSITGFNPAEDTLRFDDANVTPQAAATFLNGVGGALVTESAFTGNTVIALTDDNIADAVPPAQVTLIGLEDDTLGGGTPFFEVV